MGKAGGCHHPPMEELPEKCGGVETDCGVAVFDQQKPQLLGIKQGVYCVKIVKRTFLKVFLPFVCFQRNSFVETNESQPLECASLS